MQQVFETIWLSVHLSAYLPMHAQSFLLGSSPFPLAQGLSLADSWALVWMFLIRPMDMDLVEGLFRGPCHAPHIDTKVRAHSGPTQLNMEGSFYGLVMASHTASKGFLGCTLMIS